MTRYHLKIWRYDGNPTRINYPCLVIEHGLVGTVIPYIEAAHEPRVFPPVDKERSKIIGQHGCSLTAGGMIYTGGKWSETASRWHAIEDICEIEVGNHDTYSYLLQNALRRADERHPDWCMVGSNGGLWRVVFNRATAERIIAYIAANRAELDAWEKEYNDDFNASIAGIPNDTPVIIPHKGAPGPAVLVPGPAEEC